MPDETASAWRVSHARASSASKSATTRALREHPGLEDGGDRRELVLADLRPPEADSLFYFALYHSIVLASPSSSSTLGSHPSSSRAFSTFGMRSSTST